MGLLSDKFASAGPAWKIQNCIVAPKTYLFFNGMESCGSIIQPK